LRYGFEVNVDALHIKAHLKKMINTFLTTSLPVEVKDRSVYLYSLLKKSYQLSDLPLTIIFQFDGTSEYYDHARDRMEIKRKSFLAQQQKYKKRKERESDQYGKDVLESSKVSVSKDHQYSARMKIQRELGITQVQHSSCFESNDDGTPRKKKCVGFIAKYDKPFASSEMTITEKVGSTSDANKRTQSNLGISIYSESEEKLQSFATPTRSYRDDHNMDFEDEQQIPFDFPLDDR